MKIVVVEVEEIAVVCCRVYLMSMASLVRPFRVMLQRGIMALFASCYADHTF